MSDFSSKLIPLLTIVALIAFWEFYVRIAHINPFILPAPTAIFSALIADFGNLIISAAVTLKITFLALVLAVVSGISLALLFSLSPPFEKAFFPLAVILQVTPVVSIAPLIVIWVGLDNVDQALLIIAWIVAFFPILANLSAGLKSVDPALEDLFKLYNASRWQRFFFLLMPTAMPYLFASLKISAGLALIGAVVAEFVAGSGASSGLAWRILEAGNRLQIAKMMAGLLLLAVIGVAIYYMFASLEKYFLRHRRP